MKRRQFLNILVPGTIALASGCATTSPVPKRISCHNDIEYFKAEDMRSFEDSTWRNHVFDHEIWDVYEDGEKIGGYFNTSTMSRHKIVCSNIPELLDPEVRIGGETDSAKGYELRRRK